MRSAPTVGAYAARPGRRGASRIARVRRCVNRKLSWASLVTSLRGPPHRAAPTLLFRPGICSGPPLFPGRHAGRPLRFCSARVSVPGLPSSRATARVAPTLLFRSGRRGGPAWPPVYLFRRAVGAGLAPARSTFPGLPSSRATARVAPTLLFRSGRRGGPAWPPVYLFRLPGERAALKHPAAQLNCRVLPVSFIFPSGKRPIPAGYCS